MRIMSDMSEGVVGYACSADDALDTDTQLMYVLYWMDVLDHLWAARPVSYTHLTLPTTR